LDSTHIIMFLAIPFLILKIILGSRDVCWVDKYK